MKIDWKKLVYGIVIIIVASIILRYIPRNSTNSDPQSIDTQKQSTGIRIEGGSDNSLINNIIEGFDTGIEAVNTTNLNATDNIIK